MKEEIGIGMLIGFSIGYIIGLIHQGRRFVNAIKSEAKP